MKLCILFLALFLISFKGVCQSSFFENSDSLNSTRSIVAASSISAVWAGSMIGLSNVWYKGVDKTSFHTFDDSRNWLQMDKAGHVYTANKISNLTGDLFIWSGVQNNKAAWIGFGTGVGYQLTLEMLDAYSSKWGFSWSDVGANVLGSSIYLGQQLAWKEQRFIMKFSAHPSEYAHYRPEVLGSSFAERLLKDYNGQTYWLSASPGSFAKNSGFPQWLCFSVGYSVDEKLVGDKEIFIDYGDFPPASMKEFNAKRQLLFSLDIDFSKLNIKRPWLRTIVKQFNYLKLPFPTLIFSNGKANGSLLYF